MVKAKRITGTVITVVVIFLGLADAPEQLAKWKAGLDGFVAGVGIDWSAFWSASAGRTVIVLVGVLVGLWAWDVPRLARRRWRGEPVAEETRETDLGYWDETSKAFLDTEALAELLETARRERDSIVLAAKTEAQHARNELDNVQRQLKATKKDYNEERLRHFAQRAAERLEMAKSRGEPPERLKPVQVMVRFAVYSDLPLAQQIERILKEHTGWPVELDMSNKPILLPHEKGFKVMFDIGAMGSFMPVAYAFDDGQLIDASVGVKRTERWEDSERLVVEVLPTTP